MSQPLLVKCDAWQALIDRLRAGDSEAANQLFSSLLPSMSRLARSMLRRFPTLRRSSDADDILQSALLRLVDGLRRFTPAGPQDFQNLARVTVRRVLLDLARRRDRRIQAFGAEGLDQVVDPAPGPADDKLTQLSSFHRAVEQLPTKMREVFVLTYYHGWSQTRIAQLLGVSERMVRNYLRGALGNLRRALEAVPLD